MSPAEVWLVAIIVTMAVLLAAIAVAGFVWGAKVMISYARYELDAGERALRMQAVINDRVQARLQTVRVAVAGGAAREAGEQPPDPNVRTTSRIDEVHEAEREANRLRSATEEWDKRDSPMQPLPPHLVEI